MKCNGTKEKRGLFLSAEVTSYHFRSGGSNPPPFCAQARILAYVFSRLFITILILFLGIASVGSYEICSKVYQLTFQFEVDFYLNQGTSSRAVMPGSLRNHRRRNSKHRAVSRLRGYNVSPERPKRGRAQENDGPRPSNGKERASSRPRLVARLPDECHTKSRTRSRSRSTHHDRRANRSESNLESRAGSRTSEDAETSERPEWAKDIKTIVATQQNNAERLQFLETELRKANKRKDPKEDTKPEYKFSKGLN